MKANSKKFLYNMLSILNHGLKTKKLTLSINNFKYASKILNIFVEKGYIFSYILTGYKIKIIFKTHSLKSPLSGFKVSYGQRYHKCNNLLLNGLYSTSLGFMLGSDAKKLNVGGILLFIIC